MPDEMQNFILQPTSPSRMQLLINGHPITLNFPTEQNNAALNNIRSILKSAYLHSLSN